MCGVPQALLRNRLKKLFSLQTSIMHLLRQTKLQLLLKMPRSFLSILLQFFNQKQNLFLLQRQTRKVSQLRKLGVETGGYSAQIRPN